MIVNNIISQSNTTLETSSIDDLKLESFVTALESEEEITVGGGTWTDASKVVSGIVSGIASRYLSRFTSEPITSAAVSAGISGLGSFSAMASIAVSNTTRATVTPFTINTTHLVSGALVISRATLISGVAISTFAAGYYISNRLIANSYTSASVSLASATISGAISASVSALATPLGTPVTVSAVVSASASAVVSAGVSIISRALSWVDAGQLNNMAMPDFNGAIGYASVGALA